MDFPNAFIGRKTQPSSAEVTTKLGPAATAWKELVAWLAALDIACNNWQSTSPKYGWLLRPTFKKRTILYMIPCEGCFRVSFALSDKAVAAARASNLPRTLLIALAEARRYAEGTGIRLMIRKPEDLPSVRKLVEIKLKN